MNRHQPEYLSAIQAYWDTHSTPINLHEHHHYHSSNESSLQTSILNAICSTSTLAAVDLWSGLCDGNMECFSAICQVLQLIASDVPHLDRITPVLEMVHASLLSSHGHDDLNIENALLEVAARHPQEYLSYLRALLHQYQQ